MNRDQAVSTLRIERERLRREYGVKSLALFGSVARDESSAASDVDLLVEFDRPTGLLGLFALQEHLEQLLGCPVDLGTPASLKPRVRQRVMSEIVYVN
ncbi:MAG: nucleotidyltransferase family protein [Anaerolineae bacterium]|nr:nucleotidyltransferase family protein [Anaerolineae bacterium]MCB0200360.1 nucleotidyltransferase family protein [Anaerolineae bacterium]MCB0254299.1 nucleotidyltransferase family protein [Anaerolineae bacterium]